MPDLAVSLDDMTMQCAQYDRYGGPEVVVLRAATLPEPGRGQLLVRIHAAALNPKDLLVQAGRTQLYRWMVGPRFPKRVGYDWSGEVVAAGPGVTGHALGDARFGMIDSWAAGACASHAIVEVGELACKPAALSWEEAAAVPLAAQTALQALRDIAQVRAGERVLINGASGGVGTFAVQIAKLLGARVTAVASARNAELVTSLGADDFIDYATTELASAGLHDVFFDVYGNRSFAIAAPMLSPRGIYISTVPKGHVLRALATTLVRRKRARLARVRSRAADLATLAAWLERGTLRPVIDRVFPLAELAAAEQLLGSRRARGKIVLRMPG